MLVLVVSALGTADTSFWRYLDLTPAMEVLPRGELAPEIALDIRHYRLEITGDSTVISGYAGDEPVEVLGIAHEITIVESGDSTLWSAGEPLCLILRDSLGRPVRMVSRGTFPGHEVITWEWEEDRTVTVRYPDSSGNPLPIKLKPVYTGAAAALNEHGELVEHYFLSVPAWGFRYVLDSPGRALSVQAVDTAGNPVPSSEGIWEKRYGYDDLGNTFFTAFVDSAGNLLPGDYALPDTGNWEFGPRGVVINAHGTAYVLREYDDECLYISETSIGVSGTPVADGQGRVTTLFQREEHGGITECMWYDDDHLPVEVAGIWRTSRIYDDRGRVIETSTFDADNRLAEFTGGFAITRFSYHPHGGVALISYYDSRNEPVMNTLWGCHARDHRYDETDQLLEVRYLDTEYRQVNNTAGYARVVFQRGPDGIVEVYYDSSGEMLLQD